LKFRFSEDFVIDTDLEPWRREGLRIAMLGGPVSGKSWNNSIIAEQFLEQGGTVIIFQPRDEYFTLKEKFDVLSVGGVHAKDMEFALTSPSIYAKAVVEDGMSMIFYTSAAEDEEKLINWVQRFIRHVLNYQEHHKRPILLILEEAQEYAPRSPSGHVAPPWVYNRMVKAFKDCFTQGRKLNIIAIASSQRPQELNFTIRQLANLSFYGKFGDQDIGYVDKECLKYIRKQGIEVDASRLVTLGLGEWLVIMGKQTQFLTVTQKRLTKHGAETPRLEYVAPRTTKTKKTIDQLTQTIMETLKKEETEKSELEKSKRQIRDLKNRVEAAEDKAKIKLAVRDMLKGDGDSEELVEKLTEAQGTIKQQREQLAKDDETITRLSGEVKGLSALREFKEAVKKVFEFAGPPAAAPMEAGSQTVKLHTTKIMVETTADMKHAQVNDKTVRGKILTLAKTRFFSKWQGLGDVHKGLIENFGWTINKPSLDVELMRMTKDFLLGVKRDRGRKQKVYKLAANVVFKED